MSQYSTDRQAGGSGGKSGAGQSAGIFGNKKPDYLRETDKFETFFRQCTAEDRDSQGNIVYKYYEQLKEVAQRKRKRVQVELDDIVRHFENYELCLAMERNALRYTNLAYDAIDNILMDLYEVYGRPFMQNRPFVSSTSEEAQDSSTSSLPTSAAQAVFEQFMYHRMEQQHDRFQQRRAQQRTEGDGEGNVEAGQERNGQSSFGLPKELLRHYEISFIARSALKPQPLRSIKSKHIGSLVVARGIVTRASDVKAELKVATYVCDKCMFEVYQEVNSRQFTPLTKCPSVECRKNGLNGHLIQQTRGSKFVKFQELKLQEMTDEVPTGSIPRTVQVFARGELTRQCGPGDQISLTGVFLPRPLQSMNAVNKQGPVATTYILAHDIKRHKKRYDDYALDESILQQILRDHSSNKQNMPDMYSQLANSIAPEIYGHENVKKALLLMLVGGVTRDRVSTKRNSVTNSTKNKQKKRRTSLDSLMMDGESMELPPEDSDSEDEDEDRAADSHAVSAIGEGVTTSGASMKIRGDINVCLMGDPGVAKSQLLRYIAQLSPRGIYTTGKGSSGVGLTAAVIKDSLTGEMVLEGGALVLADNGICCIDEFDKMDEYDRSALHEVMEQQSVSIAKAGITTTLNARASVLAAANPAYSRYNIRKSPSENINLPPALLSRFDLLFLLLDKQDDNADMRLARHITHIHTYMEAPSITAAAVARETQQQQERDLLGDDGEAPAPSTNRTGEHFDSNYLRCYIAHAKRYKPFVPVELTNYIATRYVELRQHDSKQGHSNSVSFTTPRTLLAILRLSSALARLRFSNTIIQDDVDEAIRLMESSKQSLFDTDGQQQKAKDDPVTEVYNIIRNRAITTNNPEVRLIDVSPLLAARGLGSEVVQKCLDEYEYVGVWLIGEGRNSVKFV